MKSKIIVKGGVLAERKGVPLTSRRNVKLPTRISIETKKKDSREKRPFPWSTVFLSVTLTAMFLFAIMNYVILDTLNDEITARSDRLDELIREKDRLETAVEKMNNVEEIREYAVNNLGMIGDTSEAETYYIDIHGKDEVMIYEYEDEPENGIAVLLTGVGNVLKGFFGD